MPETDAIPPSPAALSEAFSLSSEILRNIELNELPLSNIALKASRLSRLLNDFDFQEIMEYESGGYPSSKSGWELAVRAGRRFELDNSKTGKPEQYWYPESITSLEQSIEAEEVALASTQAVSSANPNEWSGFAFRTVQSERRAIIRRIRLVADRLASRKALIYKYALRKHYELKFSGIADDIFARIRERVDTQIGQYLSDGVKRLTAVYENLRSDNPEDWSNSVHSCRRILQDLADVVFPSTEEERSVEEDGKKIRVKLGAQHYKNRLMAFIQDRASSQRFQEIVGSHLKYIGERLDSVFLAAQKGSHKTIVRKERSRPLCGVHIPPGWGHPRPDRGTDGSFQNSLYWELHNTRTAR